jgi:hypothetical protein
MRLYLEKPFTKIGLVKWLKVKTQSSSPKYHRTKKKKRKTKKLAFALFISVHRDFEPSYLFIISVWGFMKVKVFDWCKLAKSFQGSVGT